MNRALYQQNTRLILILFAGIFAITLLRFIFMRLLGITFRFDNTFYGLIVFGSLFFYYRNNNLFPRITTHPWVLAYCTFIALSFVYGVYRFRTPTTAIFDLWLFAFIPAFMLIPAHSFDVRQFDRILAVGVLLGSAGMGIMLILRGDMLFDRSTFGFYSSLLAALATGHVYLLFKYALSVSWLTYVGLLGVTSMGVLFGVVGSFRGHLLLAFLAVLLFFYLHLRSTKVAFSLKFVSLSVAVVVCAFATLLALTRFEEQLTRVVDRFTVITDTYERTGGARIADGRWNEAVYFRQLNPDYKLILGHGVGGLWWDFFGMYEGQAEMGGQVAQRGGFAGARTMLHTNWLHVLFKIGIVGFFLMIGMLVAHFKKHPGILRNNPAWWAFLIYYAAWTTYYGDKELTVRAVILLAVLVSPWLFKTAGPRPGLPPAPPMARHSQSALGRRPLRPQPMPAFRRAFPPPP